MIYNFNFLSKFVINNLIIYIIEKVRINNINKYNMS